MDYVGLVSTVGLIVPDDGDALAELLTDLCGVEFVHVSHFMFCSTYCIAVIETDPFFVFGFRKIKKISMRTLS